MAFSKPDPHQPHSAAESHSAAGNDKPIDKDLLDRVLQETLTASSIDPREMSALVDIGRRYNGQPLTLEPVAVELVEVILRNRLSASVKSDRLRRDMSQQIAESLLDNTETEERFRAFWARLVEAAR